MKHLCIINPMAGLVKGHVNEVEDLIHKYFAGNPGMDYSIHITRWKRDASGYILRYVTNASEMVRVYAFGGEGTLFEVINGAVGLPNVQVAWYPLGRDNNLLAVFGRSEPGAFQSLKGLILSPVITIDTILAGNHYVTANVLIGIEAVSYLKGKQLSNRFLLSRKICYYIAGFFQAFLKPEVQHYRIETESTVLEEDLMGVLISNVPSHALGTPAPDALLDDGYMDMYTIKPVPKGNLFKFIRDYYGGRYDKWPDYIRHYRCKKLKLTSSADMTVAMDGELFFDTELNFEIRPSSLDFVCPPGVYGIGFFLTPPENPSDPSAPAGPVGPSDEFLPAVSEVEL